MVKHVFISDCEGPISKNDNAFELTAHFIPEGEKLFSLIIRSTKTNPYAIPNKIPGVFVMTDKAPKIPATIYCFFSKKRIDDKTRSIKRVSGEPTDRTTYNLGNKTTIIVSINGALVRLNVFKKL